tara:strand:+ start:3061 stop:3741 length:681 start_codon:yes stop_codon:yes gene_type:complete
MTHCASELAFPSPGLGWTAPNPVRCELTTRRLSIRAFRLDEAQSLNHVVVASRDRLLPWLPWARSQHEHLAGTAKFIAEQQLAMTAGHALSMFFVGIFDSESGELLGGTGVSDIRANTASCEIGYWIRSDRQGLGYATEACARVLSWALSDQSDGGLGLRRVRIYCSAANEASRRVPTKLGLHKEVHQREDYYVEGHGPTDRLGWGVMAQEWDCTLHRLNASDDGA